MEKISVSDNFWNEITIFPEEINCHLFESIGEFYQVRIPDSILRKLVSRDYSLLRRNAEMIDTYLEFNHGKCILTVNGFSLSKKYDFKKDIEILSNKINEVYEHLTVDF